MSDTVQRFLDIIAALIFVLYGCWGIITFVAERRYPGSPQWFRDQLNSQRRVFHWPRFFFYSLLAGAWLLASFSGE